MPNDAVFLTKSLQMSATERQCDPIHTDIYRLVGYQRHSQRSANNVAHDLAALCTRHIDNADTSTTGIANVLAPQTLHEKYAGTTNVAVAPVGVDASMRRQLMHSIDIVD